MEGRKKTNSETTGFFSFLNIFLYHVFFLMTNFPSVCVCARQAETLRPFRAPPILNIKFPSPSNQNWRISISFEEKRQE